MNSQSQNYFFIFIGRSGSGKGTQANLLKKFLDTKTRIETKHITTGGNFREFIQSDSWTAKRASDILNHGLLMPGFLAIWNWSNILLKTITGNEHIILDGAPRKLIEVQALDSAMEFYPFAKPIVVYLDVTIDWAVERLQERGREDDASIEEIRKKMGWFDTDVKPVIDWYASDPRYTFIHVNGERTIEEIHEDIVAKVSSVM